MKQSVRELHKSDLQALAGYWMNSGEEHLKAMGVDLTKLPDAGQLSEMLSTQLKKPLEQRRSYCLIWELDGVPVGHCNTNPTVYGGEAFMHLHLWERSHRAKGMGLLFVQLSLPHFFKTLHLQKLISEPYALNEAPNRTLEKAGFCFVKEYLTVPGSINFEQPVKRWELTAERYNALFC